MAKKSKLGWSHQLFYILMLLHDEFKLLLCCSFLKHNDFTPYVHWILQNESHQHFKYFCWRKKVSEIDHCFFQFHNTWYNKISQLLLTVFVEDWDSVFPGKLNGEIDIRDNFCYNVTISYNG